MTNILYIHSHDTGRYVQPYGYPIDTPAIQRLAQEGVLFRQAFTTSPTCTPSRASMLTGQYAHTCGMFGLAHRGFVLAHPEHHLAHYLGTLGYQVVLAGMQHEHKDPHGLGYQDILATPSSLACDVAPAVIHFLHAAPRHPFFLSVGFQETHRPYAKAGSTEDPRYCLPPALFPDNPATRQEMANFKASARQLDWGIGSVLTALEENGLAQDTLVICTTDHGLAFPRMKCNLNQHGQGVMLIMRGPGALASGQVIDALVSQIDIFPTLCDLLRLPSPDWLQGVSLMPLIHHEVDAIRKAAFGEINFHCVYEPIRSARTTRWSYLHRFENYAHVLLPNCDASLTKDLWVANGWTEQIPSGEELYDLYFDPNEVNNLAGSPEHLSTLKEMGELVDTWMAETEDPLLQGPIPALSGAELNPWDAESADDRNYIVG